MIVIRDYQPQDSKALAKIFENAILAIDHRIYSTSQKQEWIGNHSDEFWQHRFEKTLPFMAVIGDRVVGFIEFGFDDGIGEIDCFYIEPKFQQQGVGQTLFEKVLSFAKGNNVYQINVSASHIAKPFFAKQGFKVIRENSVVRSNVTLENWLMVKQ